MPTANRRVATYLPPELDDRFKAFITERNLKGDSQALITILSEFLGVSLPVAQIVDYSSFVRVEQFNELVSKVSQFSAALESKSPGAMIRKLNERVDQLEKQLSGFRKGSTSTSVGELNETHNTVSEVLNDAVSPGQMDLLEIAESELPIDTEGRLKRRESSNSNGESASELKPLHSTDLAKRFKVGEGAVRSTKSRFKDYPERFAKWLKKKDPEGVSWEYNSTTKLYHPISANQSTSELL